MSLSENELSENPNLQTLETQQFDECLPIPPPYSSCDTIEESDQVDHYLELQIPNENLYSYDISKTEPPEEMGLSQEPLLLPESESVNAPYFTELENQNNEDQEESLVEKKDRVLKEKKAENSIQPEKKDSKVKRNMTVKGKISLPRSKSNQISAIPVKKPPSKLVVQPSKTNSLIRSPSKGIRNTPNKHTLEVQFMNKHKRLLQYKKELLEKQRPVMDLYQNLLELKKQLAEFGKIVEIDDVKFVMSPEDKAKEVDNSAGDALNKELVQNMQSSIEHIPKMLMGVCQNLVTRRAAIVELLENVSQAEIKGTELSDKIETLKDEGVELKQSLDALITDSEQRIGELIRNWYTLLDQKSTETTNTKIEELETQIKQKDVLLQESKQVILDLQRKFEDKRTNHDKNLSEFEVIVKEYTEKIKKLEHDLENEKKIATDQKSRNTGNSQTIKNLKYRLSETENKFKVSEDKCSDLSKKLKTSQDLVRQKELQWIKEKEELTKNLKEQEKLVQKLAADKHSFQSRLESTEESKKSDEEQLQSELDGLQKELTDTKRQLEIVTKEKDEISKLLHSLEAELSRLGTENTTNMHTLSNNIDWGKSTPTTVVQAELYSQLLATKVTLRECEEKLKQLEKDNIKITTEKEEMQERINTFILSPEICKQEEVISRYKDMLIESEQKLNEKSVEVAKLNGEMKHLKIRQDALEEQNLNCPSDELKKIVLDGRSKLSDLMKKSMENEQKLSMYENTIEKQHKQMNEMENLLRVRDGLIGMIKAKKDELLMEKDSLTRYCKDVRNMLAETREDLRIKSETIRDLQEKVDKKDKQCTIMEKKIRELEDTLAYTNEKRFKLQDTIGSMEKELQSTKAHVNQMAELQSRYDLGMTHSKNSNSTLQLYSTQNPTTFESLTFHQQCSECSLELPIREVDLIRRKLSKLSQFKLPTELGKNRSATTTKNSQSLNLIHSTKSMYAFGNKTAYQKMIELETKRYEILQKETDDSYENLSYLLKLSLPSENSIKGASNDNISSETFSAQTSKSHLPLARSNTKNKVAKKFDLNPKLHYNKIYFSHLSKTYKDIHESLKVIKNSLTDVDEIQNNSICHGEE